MAQLHELIKMVASSNRNSQDIILKDIAALIQYAKLKDLKLLLGALNVVHDMELHVKIFSILALYLVSNSTHTDVIIKHNPIYDKAYSVLSKGLPLKTTTTLNFLTTLLYIDEENNVGVLRKHLVIYAQNMIRISGCLAAMCKLFVTTTMYHESWRSLCRCLGESCRECEDNQNYCSHLVPLCLQRCVSVNMEIIALLQNLLYQHNRNIQLFIDSDGMLIFNRDSLQYESSMQLLSTVVQSTTPTTLQRYEAELMRYLHHILHLHGPYSQMGQWATITLYHINSQNKHNKNMYLTNQIPKNTNITRDVPEPNEVTFETNENVDTGNLFQNIVKEFLHFQSKNVFTSSRVPHSTGNTDFVESKNKPHLRNLPRLIEIYASALKNTSSEDAATNACKAREKQSKDKKELCFDFLLRRNIKELHNDSKSHNAHYNLSNEDSCMPPKYTTINNELLNNALKYDHNNISTTTSPHFDNTIFDLDFSPAFASTPKKHRKKIFIEGSQPQILQSFALEEMENIITTQSSRQKQIFKGRSLQQATSFNLTKYKENAIKKQNKKVKKMLSEKDHRKHTVKEIKNRSMSAKLLDVINDSCTTLIKTFKNIFKPQQNSRNNNRETISSNNPDIRNDLSCSYSFTKYMMQRDVLAKNSTKTDSVVYDFSNDFKQFNSCKTCDDTLTLKQKLAENEYLKQTVKKLKVGINLYGCNFKKISSTLWPREPYMTPAVLYNLYRKLIVK